MTSPATRAKIERLYTAASEISGLLRNTLHNVAESSRQWIEPIANDDDRSMSRAP
jgi:hypothetical protein